MDESRDLALKEVLAAMLSKKEFVLSKYRAKKLPEYVIKMAGIQIDAEIQREECELSAAYNSMSSDLRLTQRHSAAMVEGLLPATQVACTNLELSYMEELNATRESFGSEVVRKHSKKRVLAHAVMDAEANRLTLLGRPVEELQNLEERLNASLEMELKSLMEMVTSDWRRMEVQLKDNLKDKQNVQLEYGKRTDVLAANFLEKLKVLKNDFALEREHELDSSADHTGILRLEQKTVAKIAAAYVSHQDALCEEFRKALSHQHAIETIEDDSRDLRNRKQQENEAYENTYEELRLNKLEDLTGKQLIRRKEFDERINQYERDLIGLEEQLRLKKDKAQKFLQDRLAKAREAREKELRDQGLSSYEAKKVAAEESKEYEEHQRKKLTHALDQQEEGLRQAFFNTLEKRTADATRRKAILKECIPFGLQEFERRETAELSQQLAEELNALQLSLQAGGCSEGEAKHQASERLSDTHKQHLRALEASQKNVGPELIALLKADAVEDIMRLNTASASILSPEQRQEEEHRVNSTRDSAIISLSVGLNSVMEKRSSSAQLTDNLSRREAAAVEEKMWASAEVEAAAIRQRLENAIDQSHDDGMMKLRCDYDKALNGLEVAYQVSKQTQKKNLLNRINLRKEQRRRELEQQRGLNESEARNQVSAEFCDDAQRVADLEARIEQEKVIAIAEQEDLVEDSLSGSKHPSTALSGKEDMEASILLQKLMQDETNLTLSPLPRHKEMRRSPVYRTTRPDLLR